MSRVEYFFNWKKFLGITLSVALVLGYLMIAAWFTIERPDGNVGMWMFLGLFACAILLAIAGRCIDTKNVKPTRRAR